MQSRKKLSDGRFPERESAWQIFVPFQWCSKHRCLLSVLTHCGLSPALSHTLMLLPTSELLIFQRSFALSTRHAFSQCTERTCTCLCWSGPLYVSNRNDLKFKIVWNVNLDYNEFCAVHALLSGLCYSGSHCWNCRPPFMSVVRS